MIIPGFSATSVFSDEARRSIALLQSKLADAQTELSTGRYADVGKQLGATTGTAISFRQDISQMDAFLDSNGSVDTRLKASQAGLQAMSNDAQSLLTALVSAKASTDSRAAVVQQGQSSLKSFIEAANTTVDGQYLFAGINTDVKPVDDFFAPTSPASQAVTAAFTAKFGFAPTDPAVSTITASAMQSFLDNEYSSLFTDPSWGSTWSSASDKVTQNRISRSEVVDTSVSANDQAFRKMASAYGMLSGIGFENMNEAARQVVLGKAISDTGDGISGIAKLQSSMGVTQQRVTTANDTINVQKNVLNGSLDKLEGVDPAEVSTRLANLMTQMETAYTLTNRLNQLSLINYLK